MSDNFYNSEQGFTGGIVLAADSGTDTRLAASGAGTQVISHNLGVVPKRVRIVARGDNSTGSAAIKLSDGVYDGSNNECVYEYGSAATFVKGTDSSNVVRIDDAGTSLQTGTITAWTASDFTITWAQAVGGQDVDFHWEVLGGATGSGGGSGNATSLTEYLVIGAFPVTTDDFGSFPSPFTFDTLFATQSGDGGGGGSGGDQYYSENVLDFGNDFRCQLSCAIPSGHQLKFGVVDFSPGTNISTSDEGGWFEIDSATINAVNSNGSSDNTTNVTGATDPTTLTSFVIEKEGTDLRFYVNGTLETTHTTFFSTSTTCRFVIQGSKGNDSNTKQVLLRSIDFRSTI